MDFKTESQVLQELIDTWKLVDQYKVTSKDAIAEIDKLHVKVSMLKQALENLGELMICGKRERCSEASKIVLKALATLKED